MTYQEIKIWLMEDPVGVICLDISAGLLLIALVALGKIVIKKLVERWVSVKKSAWNKFVAHSAAPRVAYIKYAFEGDYRALILLVIWHVQMFVIKSIGTMIFAVSSYFSAELYGATFWTLLLISIASNFCYSLCKEVFPLATFYSDIVKDVAKAKEFVEKFPVQDTTVFREIVEALIKQEKVDKEKADGNALPR